MRSESEASRPRPRVTGLPVMSGFGVSRSPSRQADGSGPTLPGVVHIEGGNSLSNGSSRIAGENCPQDRKSLL